MKKTTIRVKKKNQNISNNSKAVKKRMSTVAPSTADLNNSRAVTFELVVSSILFQRNLL